MKGKNKIKSLAEGSIEEGIVKAEMFVKQVDRAIDHGNMDFLVSVFTAGFLDRSFRQAKSDLVTVLDKHDVSSETRKKLYRDYGMKC